MNNYKVKLVQKKNTPSMNKKPFHSKEGMTEQFFRKQLLNRTRLLVYQGKAMNIPNVP